MRGVGWVILVGGAMLGAEALGQTPSLTLLGIPKGRGATLGGAISADGRVVAGYTFAANTPDGGNRGFSWTASGGMDEWGGSTGIPANTQPTSITADGSTIFGMRQPSPFTSPNDLEAFRYSNGTYQNLGTLPGFNRVAAYGASGDGSVAVGLIASTEMQVSGGMRWTPSGGVERIGLPRPNSPGGWFTGISRDGVTAIGTSVGTRPGGLFDAYTWTRAGGWRELPVPGGMTGGYDATPRGTNFDGSIIVGDIKPFTAVSRAVLWRNGQTKDLGNLGSNWEMEAHKVSDNGGVIVGQGRNISRGEFHAVLWLGDGPPVLLQDYLATLGVQLPDGLRLEWCDGLSADGLTIVGTSRLRGSIQAFVATIPAPSHVGLITISVLWGTIRRTRGSIKTRTEQELQEQPESKISRSAFVFTHTTEHTTCAITPF